MKNILFVLNIYPGKGGIESVTNTLVEYLCRYFRIYTLSLSEILEVTKPNGIEQSFVFPGEDYDKNIAFFNELVARLNIGVIINQGMFLHISDIIFNAERNRKVPVISCLHGMPMYEKHIFWNMPAVKAASRSVKRKWRIKMMFNRCKEYNNLLDTFKKGHQRISAESARTVLLCDEYVSSYNKYYDIVNKVYVIAVSNPLPQKYESVKPLKWDERKDEILFVGRVCEEKRVDLLLNLWRRVKNKNGWKLVIVGDGESLDELKELVSRHKIENVDFRGYTETPETYYKDAKFLALTSKFEGLGMCLIEAMRYGVVPVAFNVSDGVKSVIEESGGILVKMDDNRKFVKILKAITKGEIGDERMSEMAYAKSMRYSINTIGPRWVKIINEVVED